MTLHNLTRNLLLLKGCELRTAVIPFAGTPQGVGPVKVGQKIEAGITGLLDIHFDVGRRKSGNS